MSLNSSNYLDFLIIYHHKYLSILDSKAFWVYVFEIINPKNSIVKSYIHMGNLEHV